MTALHTVDDVAARLHKSRRWLQDWLRGKAIGRKAGRTRLFTDDDLRELVQQISYLAPQRVSQSVKDSVNLLPGAGGFVGSVVYFVRSGDFIKIGFSKNWPLRFSRLQTSAPTKLEVVHVESGWLQTEKALHRKFRHLHSHGEWFRAEPELLAFIDLRSRTLRGPT